MNANERYIQSLEEQAEAKAKIKALERSHKPVSGELPSDVIKSECIAFANWISNQKIEGRSIEKLWRDYQNMIGNNDR